MKHHSLWISGMFTRVSLSLSACFTRTHSRTHSCCCWYLDRSDSASEMKSHCSREDEMVPIEYLTAECSWRIPALPHPHPHWGWGGHELVSKVSLNKVQLPKPSQELKKCWYVLIIGLPSFFSFFFYHFSLWRMLFWRLVLWVLPFRLHTLQAAFCLMISGGSQDDEQSCQVWQAIINTNIHLIFSLKFGDQQQVMTRIHSVSYYLPVNLNVILIHH